MLAARSSVAREAGNMRWHLRRAAVGARPFYAYRETALAVIYSPDFATAAELAAWLFLFGEG